MQSRSTVRTVNLLFLLVLLLQVSNLFFLWMPQYLRLTLNQVLFVFLPAYLYLRLTRQPVRERVRWSWPGWRIGMLSFLIGLGLYPLSAVSAGVLQQLLGYTQFLTPEDVIPTTLTMALLAILSYAMLAPLCEEFLFRGVIQPAYERHSARWGVLFVGLLFIIFHLSLLQGLSIISLALALGYVNYRARSLQASILTHFGANLPAALVITSSFFQTGVETVLFSTPVLVASPLVALLALVLLIRSTRQVEPPLPAATPPPVERPLAWATSWPLLAAGAIYLVITGLEVVSARGPMIFAPLQVDAAHWTAPQTWQYELRNVADEPVGDGECHLEPGEEVIELTCRSRVSAYHVTQGNSQWSHSGGERTDRIRWSAADGQLISGATSLNLVEGEYRFDLDWEVAGDGRTIHVSVAGEPDQTLPLPAGETLLVTDYSAAWQLASMSLESGPRSQVLHFSPHTWRPETQDNGPLAEARLVSVAGAEDLTTPAGTFNARKVEIGNRINLWFTTGDNPFPVQFMVVEIWSLK
jgi:membrane protease YdiL (CAAX protease family)